MHYSPIALPFLRWTRSSVINVMMAIFHSVYVNGALIRTPLLALFWLYAVVGKGRMPIRGHPTQHHIVAIMRGEERADLHRRVNGDKSLFAADQVRGYAYGHSNRLVC